MSDSGEVQVIQPAPLPLTVQIFGGLAPDGQKVVQLIFHTPQGASFFYIPEENARWIRDKLTEIIGGIVLPDRGIAPNSRYTPKGQG